MKTHREREVYRNQNADASLWNNSLSRRKFLRSAGKVTAGVAVVGSGGILQVFASVSGKVKVGQNGYRLQDYTRTILHSTWIALGGTGQSAWILQTYMDCWAAMSKSDAYEDGQPSDFEAINPATTDVQPSATFGIVENGYYTFVMDGPIHGQYRDKVRT
jgi:hypothetical protein